MRLNILCRERLDRLLRVLRKVGGSATFRDLNRTFGIWAWEIEEAAELGWVSVISRKNSRGPTTWIAGIISNCSSAITPPRSHEIPRYIAFRHRRFAINSVAVIYGVTFMDARIPSKAEAYRMTYPGCRSNAAAAVGACRLMKRLDVQLMRRWLFCEVEGEVTGIMPWTVTELVKCLDAIGRVRYVHRGNPSGSRITTA